MSDNMKKKKQFLTPIVMGLLLLWSGCSQSEIEDVQSAVQVEMQEPSLHLGVLLDEQGYQMADTSQLRGMQYEMSTADWTLPRLALQEGSKVKVNAFFRSNYADNAALIYNQITLTVKGKKDGKYLLDGGFYKFNLLNRYTQESIANGSQWYMKLVIGGFPSGEGDWSANTAARTSLAGLRLMNDALVDATPPEGQTSSSYTLQEDVTGGYAHYAPWAVPYETEWIPVTFATLPAASGSTPVANANYQKGSYTSIPTKLVGNLLRLKVSNTANRDISFDAFAVAYDYKTNWNGILNHMYLKLDEWNTDGGSRVPKSRYIPKRDGSVHWHKQRGTGQYTIKSGATGYYHCWIYTNTDNVSSSAIYPALYIQRGTAAAVHESSSKAVFPDKTFNYERTDGKAYRVSLTVK